MVALRAEWEMHLPRPQASAKKKTPEQIAAKKAKEEKKRLKKEKDALKKQKESLAGRS